MKKVMAWLKSGKHRVAAAVGITLLLITFAAVAEEVKIKYDEKAVLITLMSGAKGLCLARKVPDGEPLPEGWAPVTCNDINTPVAWHECWIHPKSSSFLCGVKPS